MSEYGYESPCSVCGQACTGSTIAEAMNAARAHEQAHEQSSDDNRR